MVSKRSIPRTNNLVFFPSNIEISDIQKRRSDIEASDEATSYRHRQATYSSDKKNPSKGLFKEISNRILK